MILNKNQNTLQAMMKFHKENLIVKDQKMISIPKYSTKLFTMLNLEQER